MFYISLALLLFTVTVTAHILFCQKTRQQGLHARVFVLIALISLSIYTVLVVFYPYSILIDPHSLWGEPFKVTAGIIFILLVPIYLCFYVLTQLTSPSKKILQSISQRGESSYADILAAVEGENFISTRLNDLCASGCVVESNGRYILTSEGQKIVAVIKMMQAILGRNAGG